MYAKVLNHAAHRQMDPQMYFKHIFQVVNGNDCIGNTHAVISVYNFNNLAAVLLVGHIAWTYATKNWGLPQILPRPMARRPEI